MDEKAVSMLFWAIDKIKELLHLDVLFVQRPVAEFLWGYNDTLLKFLHDLHITSQSPFFSFGVSVTVKALLFPRVPSSLTSSSFIWVVVKSMWSS